MTSFTRDALVAAHCAPLESDARLDEATIAEQLRAVDGWTFADGSLRKTYTFGNYYETLAFVNALAWMIHREDHHPDLLVQYARCTVRLNTHDVGGISATDMDCAARIDALLSPTGNPPGSAA